ncbi:MAG: hydrogenase 4 subunit B, partial [Gammaproteobacteria bacterium]
MSISPLWLAFAALGSALLSGCSALVCRRWPGALVWLGFPLLGLSGGLALSAGAWTLWQGTAFESRLPLGLPWLPWHLGLDPLAGFFLALIGLVTLPVSLYGPGYIREYRDSGEPLTQLGLCTGLFVLGMELVVLAADAFSFLIGWELMSLASYFLVAFHHTDSHNRRAAYIYLLMAEIGAIAILLAYAVLAGFGGGFDFDQMHLASLSTGWATTAFLLALAGFGMKAGMVPLHAWLPEAHPVAPSYISALMSGVMLKVAIYGLIRFTFDLLPAVHWGWGLTVMLLGSLSALLGVLYALMQHDIKRLLAYHSVENIGIILIGLGLAMVYAGNGLPRLAVLGLLAALYHTLNHAIFKSLLFLGAGAILQQTRERDMERMGGLIHGMPHTAFFFLIGCISISALPPFNGFV